MESLDRVFSPLAVKSLTLKNRLVMPPMYTAFGTERGVLTERLLDHYVTRAKGGVGLIIQEATAVRPEGQGMPRWLGIWDDSYVPGWKELVGAVHAGGAKMAIQLHHAGRQTTAELIGQQPVAPSAFTCSMYPNPPRVLSVPEIVELEDAFAAAAARAIRAGYDAIELHGAHGYLIEQFMSPLSNLRQDEYGGDMDGRLRFVRNVLAKVRRVVGPDFPLCVRISADEYMPGGLTLADSQSIVPQLIAAGADMIHVSAAIRAAGPITSAPMATPRGHLLHLAAGVKQVSTAPVIAVGRIVDVEMAEDVLRSGKADLVAMGRALLADPELPNKAMQGRLEDIRHCLGCHQGCRVWPISCLVNAEVGRERELRLTPAATVKKVVVVGGGPGGLEAARVAALRGHQVTLFEQESALGGRLRAGMVAPGKQDLGRLVDYLEGQVRKLGVELRLGQTATAAAVGGLGADAVIVATGGLPIVPERPGMDRPHVVIAEDVLLRDAPVGQTVVVMGAGMTGCEVAEYLAAKGRRVTIVTRVARVDEIATDVPSGPRSLLMARLRELGVEILTGTALEEVGQREVLVSRGEERAWLPADSVVLAQGYRPNQELAGQLGGTGVALHMIGDAAACRTAMEAVREGSEIGRQI